MDIATIIALISGAVGGNIAGASMPQKNMGAIINTIAGLIGGGAGEFLLKAAGILASTTAASATGDASGFDLASLLGSIATGGVSGGALTAIIALIKGAVEKK